LLDEVYKGGIIERFEISGIRAGMFTFFSPFFFLFASFLTLDRFGGKKFSPLANEFQCIFC